MKYLIGYVCCCITVFLIYLIFYIAYSQNGQYPVVFKNYLKNDLFLS